MDLWGLFYSIATPNRMVLKRREKVEKLHFIGSELDNTIYIVLIRFCKIPDKIVQG